MSEAAARAARAHATDHREGELLAQGLIEPGLYYRWLADNSGWPIIDHIDPPDEVVRPPMLDVLLRHDGPLRLSRKGGQVTVIVPEARTLEQQKALISARPGLRASLAVASPATIREAVWQAGAADRVRRTTFELDQDQRDTSARRVMTSTQGFVLGLMLGLAMAGVLFGPFTGLHRVSLWCCRLFSRRLLPLRPAASILLPARTRPPARGDGRPASRLHGAGPPAR